MSKHKSIPEEQPDLIKNEETTGPKAAQRIAWIFAGLLLVIAIFAVYFGIQSQKQHDVSTTLSAELDDTLDRSKIKVEQMSTEIDNLTVENMELDRRLRVIAPAGFKADNFRIAVERRNDKVTTKARRADEIVVTFDLNNVPPEKQGARELYLSVTALDGSPVSVIPAETVHVPAANKPLQVSAADIEYLDLDNSQRVTMSFRPERDFEAGQYNIFIYSDAGYLGATGFRLR